MKTLADFRPYQRWMTGKALELTHLLIGAGMGLGKTAIALATMSTLEAAGDVERVLVVAPLGVARSQWHKEAGKWSFSAHLDFALCLGTARQREAALEAGATVTVVNVENLPWLLERYPLRTLPDGTVVCEWPFDMVVLDESYLFSSHSAKRFKALRFYTRRERVLPRGRGVQKLTGTPIRRLVLLTGTPAPNGLAKLYSQMFLIDDGERLGRSYTAFESTYYTKRPGASRWEKPVLKAGAEEAIHEAISDRVFVLRSEDYLDLPPIRHVTREVALPPKARRLYETLEREFLFELESGEELYAPSSAALQNKLQQVCNGAAIVGDRTDPDFDGRHEVIHDAKLDEIAAALEETEDNVVLTYWYKHDLERLRARFPEALVLGEGDIEANLERWNAGEVRLLLLHPASGGVGINAQGGGATMFWLGPIWDPYLWEQTLARLHRTGQTRGVTVVVFACADTVEQRVARSLQRNLSLQASLLEYLAERPDSNTRMAA